MNILINGTSITRGKGQWPCFLQEKLDKSHSIINLAQAGAGNTYIHESTVSEISKRPYDLVLIQWAYFDRLDIRVNDIHNFRDTAYTSEFQAKQNDWPGKIIWPVNDQDYVEKNWVFGCGYINERKDDSVGKLFRDYYKHTGHVEFIQASLIKMISLQNTLKVMNIPYLFMRYRPMVRLARFKHLYDMIDWSNFYDGKLIHTIAKEMNAFDFTSHPFPSAQAAFAGELHQDLINRKLIDA